MIFSKLFHGGDSDLMAVVTGWQRYPRQVKVPVLLLGFGLGGVADSGLGRHKSVMNQKFYNGLFSLPHSNFISWP